MINHSKKRASFLSKPFIIAAILLVAGCSLEKQSGFNRNMQNLTAHYNVLFNANEILRLKQVSYAAAFTDNYNELLNVYPDTTVHSATPDKDLEEAIAKGNKIINIKEQSHYLGDAYLVIGKANYLEGNYFNATEFLSYVIKSYPQRMDLVQQALVWKARALIYLNDLPQAKIALDTALQNIDPKKHKSLNASVYAAKLQYDINAQDYADGELMAKQAIENCSERIMRLRWTFILSQLQELNQKPGEAVANYIQISHSNVSFEMAFNASLNRIRIEDTRDGIKADRTGRLLALLKEPNNKEFKDQIYYQVAELQMKDKKVDEAIKNYKLSVRNSIKNQNQKGLSYLRLATTYFKNKADYVTAKKYYDSTLMSLPPNYHGYVAVRTMTDNLKILTDALQIIAREDTLQSLAKMNDSARNKVIDKMVSDHTLQQEKAAAEVAIEANTVNETNGTGSRSFNPRSGRPGGNGAGNNNSAPATTFYFYNSNAVTQGFNDFKRKWGDRQLEDDWRRSSRSNTNITANSVNQNATDPDAPIGNQPGAKPKTVNAGGYRAELIAGLPLTPEKLAASNLRVYHAYVDVANFYRDILNDKPEAITAYENVLRRFPNDPNRAAIYYNLYRLYSDTDPAKAGKYKDILLKEFADTPFAKIISDPNYAKRLEDENAEFTAAYNKVFDLYTAKKYSGVISGVPQVLKQYPGNKLSAQLAYLKAIAEGHSEKADAFTDTLKRIVATYPDDKLIAPLITRQLAFINENLAEVQGRPAVIIGDNPQDIPFTLDPALQEETAYRPAVTYNAKPVEQVRIDRPQDIAVAAPQQQAVKTASPASQTKPPEIKLPTPAPVKQMTELPQPKKPDTIAVVKQAVKKPDTVAKQAAITPPVVPPIMQQQPVAPPPARPDTVTAQSQQQAAVTEAKPAELKKTDLIPSIFNERDSSNYYFAVNVMSGTTNLASTRFGFGQFNRANYAGKGIKHQLLPVGNNNQVIYIGRFATLGEAKKYAREIIPLLPDIMKTTKEKYEFFIITQENLNKLADSKLLDNYYEYYQRNF